MVQSDLLYNTSKMDFNKIVFHVAVSNEVSRKLVSGRWFSNSYGTGKNVCLVSRNRET